MSTRTWTISAIVLIAALTAFGQTAVQDPFFDNYIEAKAFGIPARGVDPRSAQGYATARTAAIAQAQAALAARLNNIQVDSVQLIEMSAAIQDSVRTRLSAVIKGGTVVSETNIDDYFKLPGNQERVEVVMRLPLAGSGGAIRPLMEALRPEIIKRQDELNLPVFTPVATAPAPAAPTAVPATPATPAAPIAAEFDALIVQVPTGFKPSMAPKILSDKGEVLFSVKDIAPDILLSRGVAQYTNNEAKAKVILEGMGAKAILKVNGGIRGDTDAEVSTQDASRIFGANKTTSMLSRGRVVFVVTRPS